MKGNITNVDSDTFVDTKAKYMLTDFHCWEKVLLGQENVNTRMSCWSWGRKLGGFTSDVCIVEYLILREL